MNITDRTRFSSGFTQTRDGRTILRRRAQSLAELRAVFLHQTGFVRSQPNGYDQTIAHFIVRQSGEVLKIREPSVRLNSVSAGRGVDIEFEGLFPSSRQIRRAGRLGHMRQLKLPKTPQILAGRALLNHLRSTLGLSKVWAHRQFSEATRPNCPGPHIWYNVGYWAVQNGGLSDSGAANQIPAEWLEPSLDVVWPSDLLGGPNPGGFDNLMSELAAGR